MRTYNIAIITRSGYPKNVTVQAESFHITHHGDLVLYLGDDVRDAHVYAAGTWTELVLRP